MKITHKGQKVEAYSLIMRKENALDIVSGKKKVETRSANEFYMRMFLDFSDSKEVKMKQTPAIHFHNYNNTWHLDVMIKSAGFCYLDFETIKEFNDEFDFHDFDEDAKIYDELPNEEKPMFFWFEIDEVIGTNIAQFKK